MRRLDLLPVMLLSILVGIVLTLYPLPLALGYWRPEWLLLISLFWLLYQPARFGGGSVLLVGLLLDVIRDSVLGVHALALLLVAGAVRLVAHRIGILSSAQMLVLISALVLLAQGARLLLNLLLGGHWPAFTYWLPVPTTVLCWPLLALSLQRWRKY